MGRASYFIIFVASYHICAPFFPSLPRVRSSEVLFCCLTCGRSCTPNNLELVSLVLLFYQVVHCVIAILLRLRVNEQILLSCPVFTVFLKG